MNRAGIGSLMGESGRTTSNMDRRIADLGASQGMAPATQRMMLIKKTAADMGKIISEEDAKLFGAGEISFQDAMSRAMPIPSGGAMAMQQPNAQLQMAEGDEVSLNPLGEFSEELPLTNYILGLSKPEQSELLRNLIGVSGVAVGSIESIPMLIKRLVSTGSLKSPEAQAVIKGSMEMQERKKMAEGGEASMDEVQSSLNELQEQQPEIDAMNELIARVVEMVMFVVSEDEIMQFLSSKGLDDEEIQMVLEAVAEQLMQQQGGIQEELSALG